MNPLYKQLIRSSAFGTLVLLAAVFIPARAFDYWQGWTYVASFTVSSIVYTGYVMRNDPALLKRRMQVGASHEKEPVQKIIISLIFTVFIAIIVLPPLDHGFHLSPVPWYVSVIGNVLVVSSFYVFYLVSKVNTYAAANVQVEKGQRVIDIGVYALVRHPMYFGALFLSVGTPLALGSWWSLALILLILPLLYFRMMNEEKVLKRDLQGYEEYTRKVKYRLIPGIF